MTSSQLKVPAGNAPAANGKIGIVLIGRNEGDRLKACLNALDGVAVPLVYVDSGSIDGSVDFVMERGAEVVMLDPSIPFTAARARNAGFEKLIAQTPGLEFVHFIDGDCILETGWLAKAGQFLSDHPDVAVVCGLRREIHPDRSIYNWICNVEWNQPTGKTTDFGGDALFRVTAFQQAGGFDPALLASEETELWLRMRKHGWQVWRLPESMTRHDAAMLHFWQFWKRAVRSGYGNSRATLMNWNGGISDWKIHIIRPMLYVLIALSIMPVTIWFGAWGALPLAFFAVQIARVGLRMGPFDLRSWKYAALVTLTKGAEVQGIVTMLYDLLAGRTRKIIEYK